MRIFKLKKEYLFPFLESISEGADLWAPMKKPEGKHTFQIIKDFSQIDLDYTRTILPPRKIFLPPSFNMFKATEKKYEADFSHVTEKIIFGLHPCDIHAILIMDQFYQHHYNDPYYIEARNNTLILGHSCWPDENCLCKSAGTDIIEEGYDLFFSELEKEYLVWIGSSKGDDLIRRKPDFFDENITDKDIQKYIEWREEKDKAFSVSIDFKNMPDLMELKYKDALWEKLGQACLACGSCSNVCPTCNCYNINDKPFLTENASYISRCWDACTLESYSEVAGGENFREARSQRLKLYYTHKLQAYISKYGKPACVGCGRCIETCPVDINIKTVAQSLDNETVDAFWDRFAKEVTK
ncbi:MAG: 4Fe-4S dicluster domain-containing protein [Candidatus Aminicenantes bacterium]|nr:4Fe-4S dicluster domain-containing protein [Candidatus Aminicenantes bacterium]